MLKDTISDELFWCLAKQYEGKKFPGINDVIDTALRSLEWVNYKSNEYTNKISEMAKKIEQR